MLWRSSAARAAEAASGADGKKQAAGGLRIEQQVAEFLPNGRSELHAIANEIAVIFESAGEKSIFRGFDRAENIVECGVIDRKTCGLDSLLRIAERHFARVAEQAEAGDVGDRMNCVAPLWPRLDFVERIGGVTIESGHGSNGSGDRFRGAFSFLIAVEITPVPRALVKINMSSVCTPTFFQIFFGLISPVTA